MANANRTTSSTTVPTVNSDNAAGKAADSSRKASQPDLGDDKGAQPTPVTKANPIGSGTAFGWLNTGPGRRTTASG